VVGGRGWRRRWPPVLNRLLAVELGSVGARLSAAPLFSSASAPDRHFSIWRITRSIALTHSLTLCIDRKRDMHMLLLCMLLSCVRDVREERLIFDGPEFCCYEQKGK